MKERPILFSAPMVRAILDGRKTQTRRIAHVHGENLHHGRKLNEWDLSSGPFQLTEEDFPVWRWRGNKAAKVGDWAQEIQIDVDDHVTYPITCPYGVPGDRLWVRETWRPYSWMPNETSIQFRADNRIVDVSIPDDPSGEAWEDKVIEACADECKAAGIEADDDGIFMWEEPDCPIKWRPSIFMPRWASRITLEITDVRVQRVWEISEEDAIAEGIERVGTRFKGYMKLRDGREYDPALATTSFSQLWESINAKKHPWSSNPWVWAVTFRRVQ